MGCGTFLQLPPALQSPCPGPGKPGPIYPGRKELTLQEGGPWSRLGVRGRGEMGHRAKNPNVETCSDTQTNMGSLQVFTNIPYGLAVWWVLETQALSCAHWGRQGAMWGRSRDPGESCGYQSQEVSLFIFPFFGIKFYAQCGA